MKTVISKKLASIMPVNENLKINGITYISGISFGCGMKISESEKDYTLNLDASEFNFFCFNKNNKITCWPLSKGDQPLNNERQWKKEGRQEIKPGKFLLLFTDFIVVKNENYTIITDKEIRQKAITRTCEIFADKIKGSNEEINFSISGNISDIYQTEEHENSGYLKNSCMRVNSHYGCQPYSKFYDNIPNLQIIYKKIGDCLLFRSLLWSCLDAEGKEIKFLDRIYGTDTVNLQLIEYAKSNNWAWRTFSNNTIYFNDKPINLYSKIPNEAFDYLEEDGSPFVDTLNSLTRCSEGYVLSNYKNSDYLLTDCEGTAVNNSLTCYHCGDRINEDDTRYNNNGEAYCEYCFDENYFCCEHCGETCNMDDLAPISDHYYCIDCAQNKGYERCYYCHNWTRDSIFIEDEYYCEDCFNDKFQHCEHCEEDKRNEDMSYVLVDGNEINICEDCLGELNKCEICENYFSDNLTDNICNDCLSEKEKEEEIEKLQLTLEL